MRYMLDTNICIYLIKQKSDTLLQKLRTFRLGEIGVSVVTVAELQYGVAKSLHRERNLAALQAFLLPFEVVDFNMDAAMIYGQIRADLEKEGHPIGPLDTLIAAHALSLDVPVVTNNVREFQRVKGLRVEDWSILP
ncbi:ribonuclease VapC [Alicyclobacillus cellulosilyticus]|uniref:Ribonuclease VapC n=1 Tax=Alicyclobacillus cellulosilyticus TaxID=1003997 RepID=A0A917K5F0_9BACL|nr:type II toxin-antitoxin system VapC family toxin [Alicyclobacillus cellulosilyticus]GGJ00712.1 ribonuclease VapC [Alicyclobacillus cellulosilyticus]